MARPAVKEERREQILQGLFEAAAAGGLRGASVSEIAEAAGISRGALHYFFASKEEILVSLIARLGDRYLAGLHERLESARARLEEDPQQDPASVVRALVRWHFAGDLDRTEKLLAVWIDFWGQAPTHPAIQAAVLRIQEQARAVFERALLLARPELRFSRATDRRAMAAALLAVVEGGLLQWRVARAAEEPLDESALSSSLAALATSFVHARPSPPQERP